MNPSANNLVWQALPPWLLHPLMNQAISVLEASEMFDEWLTLGEPDHYRPALRRLQMAAARCNLLESPASPVRH